MPTAAELARKIERLPRDQYEFIVNIIMNLPEEKNIEFDEELMDKTGLSEDRREFLKSAGKIKIDKESVDEFRMRDMI